ncbi:MAG: hypothetical protein CO077_00895 [Candidatus Nealsonbacteria bacterium CG_4_9_14_0_8_um_filter_35_12]|uniref:Radical SAM core domain-containing protein n=1 Tax=Candidatus Nealsonbacteria bacterium CG_4_9_14_0_8_um_filter_35_12 TaxID=1974692 RepID=A0A2M8DN98_9BACT|nr:MAG: hypothetical protein CO077_00895 [Candidatus Nealsonbacteria bacterium CG_4_9_14_0_8_um_filter_35_12]
MAKIGYIQVTRDCNQKCIICSNPPNNRGLSFEKAKKEVDELKKKKYDGIILTGGEPTLYPKLPGLIKYCLKKKIFPRIITNGQKIADINYLKILKNAGLQHLHLSIYSYRDNIQAKISQNKNSLKNIRRALDNLKKIGGITVDINTAVSKYNAEHLSKTVLWLISHYPFVKHFVFNILDPFMNRVSENLDTIPKLNDFELELRQALEILEKNGKTFRVERAPLCYLTDYEHCSTETRKIVKNEDRMVFFLDKRGKLIQDDWYYYKKADSCRVCFLNKICAGLYTLGGKYYDEKELYPVFINPQKIIDKILKNQ